MQFLAFCFPKPTISKESWHVWTAVRDWGRNQVTGDALAGPLPVCVSLWEKELGWPSAQELQHQHGWGRAEDGAWSSVLSKPQALDRRVRSCPGGHWLLSDSAALFGGFQCLHAPLVPAPPRFISLSQDPKILYLHNVFLSVTLVLPNTLLSWTYFFKSFNF